jgi:microsomal epoxide hydrolase
VETFTIDMAEAVFDDLRARLDRTLLPNQVAGIGWEQGTEQGYLVELLDHWRHRYDWRATEARVNAVPQLVTEVEGQRIHLLHGRTGRPCR